MRLKRTSGSLAVIVAVAATLLTAVADAVAMAASRPASPAQSGGGRPS